MRYLIHSPVRLLFSMAMLAIGVQSGTVRAELLAPEQLKGCRLDVVGIYSPATSIEDDRVAVTVKPTDQPVVLVLCSYSSAQWNVTIDDETDVRQIIVSSYFESSVVGVPDEIPVQRVSYFRDGGPTDDSYFWAFAWHTQRGRDMQSRLKEMTGLDLETFQGEYSANQFVVDGKRGNVEELASQPVPSVSTEDRPEATEREIQDASAATKVAMQASGKRIGEISELIDHVNQAIDSLMLPNTADSRPAMDDRYEALVTELVKKSFRLETELQLARVEQAEERLKLVKHQLAERERAGKQIVAARVTSLLTKMNAAKPGSPAESIDGADNAGALTVQGWAAWRNRDLKTAQKRFEAALNIDPEDIAAMNGLGWVLNNRGEYQQAINQFDKLLAREPDHPAALNGVGQSLLMLGQLDRAESVLLKATNSLIEHYGEEQTVAMGLTASWGGLIRTYLLQQQFADAKQWAERYLRYDKENEPFQRFLKQAQSGLDKATNDDAVIE